MGNAGIHRNHQIEAADQCRGLGKIGELFGQVDDFGPFAQDRLVFKSWFLLQANKGRAG